MTRDRKTYIAGPMTGIEEFNYPAFNDAEDRLRSAGWPVLNPAKNHGGRTSLPRETYLKTAIRQVTRCDTIVLLDGWEDSPGARLEVSVGQELGHGIYLLECVLDPSFRDDECGVRLNADGRVLWPACGAGNPPAPFKLSDLHEPEEPCEDCGRPIPTYDAWCQPCLNESYEELARAEKGAEELLKERIAAARTPGVYPKIDPKLNAFDEPTTHIPHPDNGERHIGIFSECPTCNSVADGTLNYAAPITKSPYGCTKDPCPWPHGSSDGYVEPREYKLNMYKLNMKEAGWEDEPKPSVRAQTLDEAKRLVTGDRNAQYGPPTQDFARTADMLTALGYRLWDGIPTPGSMHALKPSDIAVIMAQLKISRLMHSRGKRDSWVDLAGYAACGAECAEEADE